MVNEPAEDPTLSKAQFDEASCAICLERIEDRVILPKCFHACFCFPCILQWLETQSGRKTCPLCVTSIGPVIWHDVDPLLHSYSKYELLRDDIHKSPRSDAPQQYEDLEDNTSGERAPFALQMRMNSNRENYERLRQREELKNRRKISQALERRRRVYRHRLYAKHVASNRYTRYRPYPGTSGFETNPSFARLLSTFLQRELQVWPHLDIAFLSFYIPALLSYVDVRSEVVMDRLAEWIGSSDDAAHLVHEMELFIRSGRGGLGLEQYDTCPWLQYDEAI